MRTIDIWIRLNAIERKIAEELPLSGEVTTKWQGRQQLFQCELEKRMNERDEWRIPAQNWLKLVAIGQRMTTVNEIKVSQERDAAASQRRLSELSREWQKLTDLARGRAPAKGGIGATTTIVVDWNVPNSTGGTAA